MQEHKCAFSGCNVIIPAGDRRIYHSNACSQAAYRERVATQTRDEARLKILQKSLAKDRDRLSALTFDFTEEGYAEYDRVLNVIRDTKAQIMRIHDRRVAAIENVDDALFSR